ncbi:N-acetylmuramoyl-L-alanine amidase [Colwellia psychrerythraea]|uniref:N-acetylmuramoyl-L-alanine amidase n=1 Tax=Colwellia psychrerythraea (strain 34H / ATCC BAA-681) TaxID=167879 RepID=Q48A25_COLP3|nr:N-acetylmuramoyl-L-alanine amidase [Colwellia psychrerythraea]AAZ25558.1 N-acetylmuramoyl-L-alanine amidase [Colwellia psychrerythraea 34H]
MYRRILLSIARLRALSFLCVAVLSLLSVNTYAANSIDGIRVWPAPENTRIVFDVKKKPDYKFFTLSKPNRLVIDFTNTKNTVALKNLAVNDPRVKLFRSSVNKGKTRLVLELTKSYQLTVFPLAPAGQYGHRLVIDLYDKNRSKKNVSKPKKSVGDIIIGIDAGHGGEDPGSIGGKGTYEKRVTLAIAKKLQKVINKEKGMKAVMIRSGDYYVNLNRRTSLARDKHVDFLVSIHADAFHTPGPSGASVWVVTKSRAESELSRWLVNREKKSELLGGGGGVIKNTSDSHLALALADMSKEHSLGVSFGVANNVIKELKKITKMHKSTPQNGNFAVLKSSDIPSILVETGFISNHKEEKNLTWSKHQQRLANAIHGGIKKHFLAHPLTGSYFASVGYKKHKVRSGESLSVLAKRYNISMSKLKSINKLKTNSLRIGQTLKIPRTG